MFVYVPSSLSRLGQKCALGRAPCLEGEGGLGPRGAESNKVKMFNAFFLTIFVLTPTSCSFFPCRFDRIAHTKETMLSDGLNTLTYKVLDIERNPLYTKITVDVGTPS